MQLGLIHEVLADGRICMLPSSFAAIRNMMLANIDGRTTVRFSNEDKQTKSCQLRIQVEGQPPLLSRDFVATGDIGRFYGKLSAEDRIINMVGLTGPMTRCGDACSYSTKDIRDQIMAAADFPQCQGHIIYCDTPGGMASSVQDLRMAINYAHDKGQRVYMLIDGMAASAGVFTAAICDKVFFVNPEDEIGSIGMYAAFFTLADGAKNTITSEVYHEYYATASTDKNAFARKASEGDMSEVAEDVEKSLGAMLANLKKDRPSILPEQMTGKMYKMSDVIGSLVDGQSDIIGCAQMLFDEYAERGGATIARKEPAEVPVQQPSAPKTEPQNEPNNGEPKGEAIKTNKMKQYNSLNKAVQIELESSDGSIYLSETQAEMVEKALADGEAEANELKSQMATLKEQTEAAVSQANNSAAEAIKSAAEASAKFETSQQEIQQMQSALDAAKTAADEAAKMHAEDIEQLKAAHAEAIKQLEAQLQEANDKLQSGITELQRAQEANEALTNQVADLNATIDQLNEAAGKAPNAGKTPANDGMQAHNAPSVVVTSSTYDPTLSAEENARRYRAAQEANNGK